MYFCNKTTRFMKHAVPIFIMLIIGSVLFPLNGQNRLTTTLENFVSLSVSGGVDVELVPSESHQMSITALNGQPEEVRYEIRQGELTIRVRPDFSNKDEIKIKLPYGNLVKIEAYSGAVINSREDLAGKNIELKASNGGKIELSVQVSSITARVTQFADIVLYGNTRDQTIHAATGGNYLAVDLVSENTRVKSSSGAQAKVTVRKMIHATAASKGFIGYLGDPASVYVTSSLGGEIVRL
jgi:hypothetical protein